MLEKSPLDSKEIKLVNPKGNQHWIFIGKTDAEAPTPWSPDAKSRLIGKRLLMLGKTEGKRRRGQERMDGWIALLTRWTWVSANFGRWWRTEEPGVLQSMGSQRVGQDLANEQQHYLTKQCLVKFKQCTFSVQLKFSIFDSICILYISTIFI